MTRAELLEIAKPILFNTEMVRAILDGRKTVTRRVVKQKDSRGIWEPVNNCRNHEYGASVPCYLHREISVDDYSTNIIYPKIDVGDYLYVRETWCMNYYHQYGRYFYRADGETVQIPLITGGTAEFCRADGLRWRPSIHMPKEAARIFLRVTDVRVERLQDINEYDAEAEGVDGIETSWLPTFISNFAKLWNSTIKPADMPKYGWDANPWVWVYEFERVIPE